MKSTNSFIKKGKKAIQDDLRREFVLSSKDETFMKLCARLKIDEKILMKYTSKLEECVIESNHCKKCTGLKDCQNRVNGYFFKAFLENDKLNFSYVPCKYLLKEEEIYSYQKKNNLL